MTQEDKDLLLKDLCARARYKVKICVPKGIRININGKIKEQDLVDTVYGVIFYNDGPKIVTPQNFSFLDKNGIYNFGGWTVEVVKPYLRPMSTMSSKERRELRQWGSLCMTEKDVVEDVGIYGAIHSIPAIDWLNAHHFDYRGLIGKGLALEAPEGMYGTQNIKYQGL